MDVKLFVNSLKSILASCIVCVVAAGLRCIYCKKMSKEENKEKGKKENVKGRKLREEKKKGKKKKMSKRCDTGLSCRFGLDWFWGSALPILLEGIYPAALGLGPVSSDRPDPTSGRRLMD